jgi:hypothetical protein
MTAVANTGHWQASAASEQDWSRDIFGKHFKFKPKYPLKAIVPVIPKGLGLFWASVFGDYPAHVAESIDKEFADALDLSKPEVRPDKFRELTEGDVLFPKRVTQWATRVQGGSGFRRNASVFFMDASKIEDVIDFWNLRASGRQVLPLPKQFLEEESFRQVVVEFLEKHRRPWGRDGSGFDVASLIRSRHSTMDEMQAFAKSLTLPTAAGKTGPATQRMSLQHWYPRLWDEWARGRDGGVADVYGEDQEGWREMRGLTPPSMLALLVGGASSEKREQSGPYECVIQKAAFTRHVLDVNTRQGSVWRAAFQLSVQFRLKVVDQEVLEDGQGQLRLGQRSDPLDRDFLLMH